MQMQQRLRGAASGRAASTRPMVAPRRAAVAVSAAGRVYNFSAGPAVLPLDVLEKAKADLINWNGSGMSVMEMSHRGKEFESIIKKAEGDLRALLKIPDNYKARPRSRPRDRAEPAAASRAAGGGAGGAAGAPAGPRRPPAPVLPPPGPAPC